ncbi:MAG: diacylglycerol kinase family protein [Polyangia bacterium]
MNPRARGVRRDRTLARRLRELARDTAEVMMIDEISSVVARLADERVDLVALVGGDGTTRAVLTAIEPAYRARGLALPRIALLRGGTMNTVARNLGIRGTPEALLERLLDRLRANVPLPTIRHTLLRVNDGLGFLFAAALGARFLERYYDHANPGPTRAVRLAIEVALSALVSGTTARTLFAPTRIDVTVDGVARTIGQARLVVASTIPEVGVGMRITPRAHDRPGRFQLVVSGLSAVEMALGIPSVQAGRALSGAAHLDEMCRTAELSLERDEPYTLDGDLFRAQKISIAVAGPVLLVRA